MFSELGWTWTLGLTLAQPGGPTGRPFFSYLFYVKAEAEYSFRKIVLPLYNLNDVQFHICWLILSIISSPVSFISIIPSYFHLILDLCNDLFTSDFSTDTLCHRISSTDVTDYSNGLICGLLIEVYSCLRVTFWN